MRHRLFLLALITILLLVLGLLRAAAVATPFHGGCTLGGISFWELRHDLPTGIYCAGLFLLAIAAFCLCGQAARRLKSTDDRITGPLAAGALIAGLPLVICSTLEYQLILRTTEADVRSIQICAGALVAASLFCRFRYAAWPCIPACLLCLLFICRNLVSVLDMNSPACCITFLTLQLLILPLLWLKLPARRS